MISSAPSALISPTMATTLLVPMSRPTNRFRSARFINMTFGFLCVRVVAGLGRHRRRDGRIAPPDGEAIRVAHVDVRDLAQAVRDHLRCGADEPLDALIDVAPAEAHGDAAVQIHFPGAALVEPQRGDTHARLEHASLDRKKAL